MTLRRRHQQGLTLTELLVASSIALVIILALGQVDVTRVRMTQDLGQNAVPQSEAAFAIAHMTRALAQADRIELVAADNIRFRIPNGGVGVNYDLPGSYQWEQYRFNGPAGEIRYFNPAAGCALAAMFRDLSGLAGQYQNESGAPPGGEPPIAPAGADNNVLLVTVSWVDPKTGATKSYTSEVTIRGGAYTDLMTGLAPAGVANPPTAPPGCS